jgi:hypothetical protein
MTGFAETHVHSKFITNVPKETGSLGGFDVGTNLANLQRDDRDEMQHWHPNPRWRHWHA